MRKKEEDKSLWLGWEHRLLEVLDQLLENQETVILNQQHIMAILMDLPAKVGATPLAWPHFDGPKRKR